MTDLTLDLRYLKTALSAAELGSFRKAAAALELPQSTISRRICLLEHRLGFPLFVRSRRGAHLTRAGSDFLNDAFIGAHQVDRAARLAAAYHRGNKGEVRVGVPGSPTGERLQAVLRRFREVHQDARVVLCEEAQDAMLHALAMGELDIAFVLGEPQLAKHQIRVLWHDSVYAVLPSDHRLARRESLMWEHIREETFLGSRGGPGLEFQNYLIRKLTTPGFCPHIEIHDVSHGSLIELVAMAYGITLTTSALPIPGTGGVVFLPIAGETEMLPSSAIWPEESSNPALRKFVALLMECAEGRKLTQAAEGVRGEP